LTLRLAGRRRARHASIPDVDAEAQVARVRRAWADIETLEPVSRNPSPTALPAARVRPTRPRLESSFG
jgi:hypothetical protein